MKKCLSVMFVLLALTGCTTAPFMPSRGALYSSTKAPLSLGYNNTDLGRKVGQASSQSFAGLFAFGDTSVQSAAKDANIKVIKHVDYEFTNVFLGLFTKTTVYVYGD